MEQFANNAATALNGSIDNTVTSVTVTDGSVFPSIGNYRLLVGAEIMLCTARSSNTLTVVRGHESTTAASHDNGANIELVFTKGSIETLLSDYQSAGGYASRPSTNLRKGQEYFATDLVNARWFYNGTNWDLIYPTYIPYANRVDISGWTAQNHSTWQFTDKNGILECRTNDTVDGNTVRGYSKNHGLTAPFSITAIMHPIISTQQVNTFLVGLRDTISGRCAFALHYTADNTIGAVAAENWNGFSGWGGTPVSTIYANCHTTRWLKVEDDGTNINYYISIDGKTFNRYGQVANNSWLTNNRGGFAFAWFKNSTYGPTGALNYQYLLGLKEN